MQTHQTLSIDQLGSLAASWQPKHVVEDTPTLRASPSNQGQATHSESNLQQETPVAPATNSSQQSAKIGQRRRTPQRPTIAGNRKQIGLHGKVKHGSVEYAGSKRVFGNQPVHRPQASVSGIGYFEMHQPAASLLHSKHQQQSQLTQANRYKKNYQSHSKG